MSEAPKIKDVFPEGPVREALLKQFGDDADILKAGQGYIDTKAKLSSTSRVPGREAPTEEWDSFYSTLGRPANPAEYKLPESNGRMKPVLEALREPAWKSGLTQEQFESLASEAASVSNQADAKLADARKQWEAKLREKLGDKADRRLQDVEASLKNLMKNDPEGLRMIQESGLDKHPDIAQLLLNVRDALGDDSAPLGASPAGSPGPTGQEINEKITTIMASKEYTDSSHPRHAFAEAKLTELIFELRSLGYEGPADERLRPRPMIRIPDGAGGFKTFEVPSIY